MGGKSRTAAESGKRQSRGPAKGRDTKQGATLADLVEILPVSAGEDPWRPDELEELRSGLRDEVAGLHREIERAEREIADRLRDPSDGAGDDQADAGAKTFEREHEMSLANNARDLLVQNERAIGRIDEGTYGVCESCGQAIGKARLQAFPRAALCVRCKQREERR